jgi:hypothetical protein
MTDKTQLEYCYSLDEECYHSDFSSIADELEVGTMYHKAEKTPYESSDFISEYFISGILEQIDERVDDEIGEAYEDYSCFYDTSKEAQEELKDLIAKWSEKHVDLLGFFEVKNSVALRATEDDLN